MKRTLICTALSLSMLALPVISEAGGKDRGNWNNGRGNYSYDGGRGHGGHYNGNGGRGHDNYYRGRSNYRGNDVLPWILGAAALGAVVSIASQPSYASTTTTYYDTPPATVYYGAPRYGAVVPTQTCTYYSDGSSVCQ
ncbi:MAG: hypothetical protein V4607_12615 [Pseudomonadota bacterium]